MGCRDRGRSHREGLLGQTYRVRERPFDPSTDGRACPPGSVRSTGAVEAPATLGRRRRWSMAKVLGVGGVFFKAQDPAALRAWYAAVLGIEMEEWGTLFRPETMVAHPGSATVLSFNAADTDYFEPSTR